LDRLLYIEFEKVPYIGIRRSEVVNVMCT